MKPTNKLPELPELPKYLIQLTNGTEIAVASVSEFSNTYKKEAGWVCRIVTDIDGLKWLVNTAHVVCIEPIN